MRNVKSLSLQDKCHFLSQILWLQNSLSNTSAKETFQAANKQRNKTASLLFTVIMREE